MRRASWAIAVLYAGCGDDGSSATDGDTGSTSAMSGDGSRGEGAGSGTSEADASTTGLSGAAPDASSTGGEAAHCDAARTAADAAADAYAQRQALVGLSIAVATQGCEPWARAWGLAETSTRTALTPDHVLRAGSVTKTYTSALVLKLAEDDLLALDDTLQTWGIDLPSADAITLWQLLDHTSGLADYQSSDAFRAAITAEPARMWAPQELVDFAIELGPVGRPGGSHAYANTNYIVAAMIAEDASGSSYAQAVRERVLSPAGLEHTYLEADETWDEPTATGYLATMDGSPPTDTTGLYHASQVWSAGAVVGTAGDMRTWIAALLGSDFLSEESQAELTSFVPAGGVDYGLGVFRVKSNGVVAFGHNGAVMGFQGAAFVHPLTGTSVAVPHNQITLTAAGGLESDPTVLALDVIAAVADAQ